jgi:hypothetical protein
MAEEGGFRITKGALELAVQPLASVATTVYTFPVDGVMQSVICPFDQL